MPEEEMREYALERLKNKYRVGIMGEIKCRIYRKKM